MTAPSSFPNASSQAPETPQPRARSYTPGFADELGDRQLAFDHATATSLEVLRFKKEIGDSKEFEIALRSRVEAFRDLEHPSLATVRSVERMDGEGLVLVSKHVTGRRVSELVTKARGPVFALELIRQVTPALATLQLAADGVSHGALSADRIVVTRDGRLVVVEHVLGSAIESLGLPRQRLIDFGLVVPAGQEPIALGPRSDMIQLGFIALSLLLGRRLEPAEYPDQVPALLDEFTKSSGSTIVSGKLRSWLERALQTSDSPFARARDAHDAFDDLPDDVDLQAAETSRTLLAFPSGEAAASPAPHVPAPAAAKPSAPPTTEGSAVDYGRGRQKLDTFSHSQTTVSKSWSGRAVWLAAALGVLAAVEAAVIVALYARPAGDVIELRSPRTDAVRSLAGSAALPAASASNQAALALLASGGASAATPAPPPPAPAPAEPAPVAAGPKFGGLTVTAAIPLQVFKEGKLIGSNAAPIAINEGSQTVLLINEALGFRLPQTVTVKGGQMTSLNISVPSGRVSINAVPWAEVLIDGTPAGQTPLANLSLPIGTHEVVFRHPQFGERKQTITVKADGLTRVSQSFQDFRN
jgi:serine/threonine-protein kinase